MSEDTPPPALRLKPRLRPNEEPAAGGAQPASPAPAAPPASPPSPAAAEPAAADAAAPRLRLKPKLAAEPAAAQPAQPVAAEAPASAPATPPEPAPAAPAPEAAQPERPRLKPRLTAEPAAAPAQAVEATPPSAPAPEPVAAAPTPPPAAPEPPPAPKPPEAPAAEGSKFKLKPKVPAPAPAAAAPSAPPPVAAPKPATRPPMVPGAASAAPAAPPPVAPPPAVPPPLVPKPPAPPPVGAQDGAATPSPVEAAPPVADNGKKKKVLTAVIGLAVAVTLAAAGYIAWVFFLAPPPPAPAPATPVAKAPAPAAKPAAVTPSDTLNQLAAAPKQMIDKAQDAIAARRGNEQDRVDAVLEGKEPPDKRFLDTPLPGHLGGQPAPAPAPSQTVVKTETQLAPGIKVTTSDLTASAPVSEEFRAFVSAVRINGVFQGNPPRALINGRTIRAGEAADLALGIVFESVDADRKTITFKDRTGATITRKY